MVLGSQQSLASVAQQAQRAFAAVGGGGGGGLASPTPPGQVTCTISQPESWTWTDPER